MKWFFLTLWCLMSVFFYPSFDGSIVLIFLSLLFALRKDFLFTSFFLSIVLDIFTGRIFAFHALLLGIFVIIGLSLLKTNLFFRKFAFLLLLPLYVFPYILFSRFFVPSFSWKEALLWGSIQTVLSIFAFFLVSYFQHPGNNKLRTPKNLRYLSRS